MECVDDLVEQRKEMLTRKQLGKRGRIPEWLNSQKKELRKDLPKALSKGNPLENLLGPSYSEQQI